MRTGIGTRAMLTAALCASALAQGAQAQVPPAPPTREELAPPPDFAQQEPQPSRLSVEDRIERAPCALAEPAYADVTVEFSQVEFRNLVGVAPQELASSWADYAGRQIPVAALCDIRDRAATALRERGFVAAVQVPPQRIEKGGTVVLDVLVAKLVGLRVRGKTGPSERLIAAQLQQLVDRPYFNGLEAERSLLLAGDLPGYDIRLVLRPAGSAPGEVIADVEIVHRPFEIALAGQNYGSSAIGRLGGLAQVRFNDLLGLGDSSRFSVFNTADAREQTVVQFGEELALGSNGLRFNGNLVYAWTRPDVANRNFTAETFTGSAEVSYPFVRSRRLSIHGNAGFTWVDQSLDFGATRLSNDKLRVLFLRADFAMMDPRSISGASGYGVGAPKWSIFGNIELRKGLSALGASPDCSAEPAACATPFVPTSRPTANPAGALLRGQAVLDFRPTPLWTVSLAPRFQIASDPLLGFEQFSAGNYTVGRGFDPGTIQGDHGVGASLELRYGNLSPSTPTDLAFQPYAFFDTAWTWLKGPTTGADHFDLQSAGGGLRAQWGAHGRADLTLAVPLAKAGFQTKRGDVRLLFSVSMQLFPW